MLPAILAVDMALFASDKDKVWYEIFQDGEKWFFRLKNKRGSVIKIPADVRLFRLYRVK